MISKIAILSLAATTHTKVIVDQSCGFKTDVSYNNFFGEIPSTAPVLFPKNETDLLSILQTTISHGCKLRVRGSGHSMNGIVVQKEDQKTVVVNFNKFETVPAWTSTLDVSTGKARMAAGKPFLELYSVVRPEGFLLPSQTAGSFFSLGGIFMNPSVHGSAKNAGPMMEFVTGLRVLLADGTIREIFDEAELFKWRGSMGLLGIVLAVEIQLIQDRGLKYGDEIISTGSNFSQALVEPMLKRYKESNDISLVMTNFYSNTFVLLAANFTGGSTDINKADMKKQYASMLAKNPGLSYNGSPISGSVTNFANYVQGASNQKSVDRASFVCRSGAATYIWENNGKGLRDLYWLADIFKPYEEMSYFFPASKVFEVLNMMRDQVLTLAANPNRKVVFNGNGVARYFTVHENTSAWQPLAPGQYVAIEMVHLIDPSLMVHIPEFAKLEAKLIAMGGIPHQGKGFGAGTNSFFQNTTVQNVIYPTAKKCKLQQLVKQYDPTGVFRAGAALGVIGFNTTSC